MATQPRTLQEAIIYFSDADNCLNYLVARRWPNGVVTCPTCGSAQVSFLRNQRRWQCSTKHPRRQFSVKVGTIFEDSPLGLDKWLPATWQIVNCRNGISSHELARAIDVTQKTAWFMLHRIRLAMQDDLTGGNLAGEVEIDETLIGGKARNMHKWRKEKVQKEGRNTGGKTVVLGMLERAGTRKPKRVRATVVNDWKGDSVRPEILGNVEKGTKLYADNGGTNWQMEGYMPEMINHAEKYVEGNVHTNGIENFWSLLKRGIGGTYVSVEPFHLFRYIDEQAFRFNNRKYQNDCPIPDHDRFRTALEQIVGKRLTYKELIGKEAETTA